MLPTTRRLRDQLAARDARIRELETNLQAAEDRAYKLARGRADVDHVISLERQVRQLTKSVTELRRGVPDSVHTLELRRQLGVERSANRALEARLREVTAANHSYDKAVTL